jgi:hypothetical protein
MRAMLQVYVGRVAAWLEILVGAGLIAVPQLVSQLIFGSTPAGPGVALARLAGIGLLSLGIAYLAIRTTVSARAALSGLLVFNAATAALLACVGAFTELHGMLLWPAVILHAGLAAGLLVAPSSPGAAAR